MGADAVVAVSAAGIILEAIIGIAVAEMDRVSLLGFDLGIRADVARLALYLCRPGARWLAVRK